MTPKLVHKDYLRIREHTKDSRARVGLFRDEKKLRVKGGQ